MDELQQQRSKNDFSKNELAALWKARSLLVILLATCQETLLALHAAANVLDTQLTKDLGAMIVRTEAELTHANEKISALGGGST
jgi:hypothetical protein